MANSWLTHDDVGAVTHLVDWALHANGGQGRHDKRWKIYQRMTYLAELGAAFMAAEHVITRLFSWQACKTLIKNAGRVKAIKALTAASERVLDFVRNES